MVLMLWLSFTVLADVLHVKCKHHMHTKHIEGEVEGIITKPFLNHCIFLERTLSQKVQR